MDYNNKTQAGAELPLVWPVYEAALVVRSSSSEFVFQLDCLPGRIYYSKNVVQ